MTLDELDSLYAKSTPGTWEEGSAYGVCREKHNEMGTGHGGKACKYIYDNWHDDGHDIGVRGRETAIAGNYDYEEGGIIDQADRALIVALHNSYPTLRDRLRALEEALVGLVTMLEYAMTHTDKNGNEVMVAGLKTAHGSFMPIDLTKENALLSALDKEAK